jgi:hypothetical protein
MAQPYLKQPPNARPISLILLSWLRRSFAIQGYGCCPENPPKLPALKDFVGTNMERTKWTSKITVILIAFLSSGCTKSAANTTEQQRGASTLFNHFETVFYAKADLLSDSGGYKRLSQQDANALRIPFTDLLQGLNLLDKQASAKILNSADAALVGAKDFRGPGGPPPGLGDVQSRFCYVLVLGTRSTFDLSKVASKAGVVFSAEDGAWEWSAPPTEGHPKAYTFYATQAHSYVLISNDPNDLHAISAKLSASGTAPDLSSIRDWETISQHEMWGYRRYRHDEANKAAAGTSEVMPDAQALTFFADPNQKTGVLRLFSPTAATADKMNRTRMLSPFNAAGTGVWETTIPLTGDQRTSERMFAAMSWFGFGVYV